MSLIQHALRAGHSPTQPRQAAGPGVLVIGGAGALGSALLEQLVAGGQFAQVSALVTQPVQTALRGLHLVVWTEPPDPAQPDPAPTAAADHTAVVVFDRQRAANGREQAFYRPQPEALPALGRWLKASGVRHLLVVMPHTQATLPEALKRGLANLDEHSVATLGFEHLVFMRTAQAPGDARHAHPAQRLAHWMLSQLQLMVPQREQAVRAVKVAEFAAQLAARLASSPPGTRVVPPELVWEAAQHTGSPGAVAKRWLSGQPLPETPPPRTRL